MALYDTVLNVVADAAAELGLGTVSAVFSNTDGNAVQLRALLKRAGRDLAKQHRWKQLLKEGTITGVSPNQDPTVFDLPADFGTYIDQTGWNRTQNLPGVPVTPQQWQSLKASASAITIPVVFRSYDSTVKFLATPDSSDTFAFEYVSRYWVAVSGSTTGTKDAPTLDTDVVLFESSLIVAALKLLWKQEKGFDTAAAAQGLGGFDSALKMAASVNQGASPVLSLSGSGGVDRLIDGANVPETGIGS